MNEYKLSLETQLEQNHELNSYKILIDKEENNDMKIKVF